METKNIKNVVDYSAKVATGFSLGKRIFSAVFIILIALIFMFIGFLGI